MEIVNHKTKMKTVLNFKQCGWFGKDLHRVEGFIYGPRLDSFAPLVLPETFLTHWRSVSVFQGERFRTLDHPEHTHTHTHMHASAPTHTHTHALTLMYTHTCTYACMCLHTHTHTHTHASCPGFLDVNLQNCEHLPFTKDIVLIFRTSGCVMFAHFNAAAESG